MNTCRFCGGRCAPVEDWTCPHCRHTYPGGRLSFAHDFKLVVDGETTTLNEFVEENPDLVESDEPMIDAIAALKPGENLQGGGGAAAEWTVSREASPVRLEEALEAWREDREMARWEK